MNTKSYRVKFSSADAGLQLAGIVDRPTDPLSQSPPVVVFSHCFTCSKDLKATVRISRALAKSGICVLRYDMRGLGGSEGNFSDSNFTTNLQDLAGAIDFASEELGAVTGLIGHSFGGVASLVTAAKQPASLASLAAVATIAAPSDTVHLADLLVRMNPAIEQDGHGEVTIGGFQWTITQQMIDDFRSHRAADEISAVPCPVLLLHSPDDRTVAFDHALRLMNVLQHRKSDLQPSPTSEHQVSLVSLPQADHLLVENPADLVWVSHLLSGFFNRYR